MQTTTTGQTEAEVQARFMTELRKALPFLPADIKLERHIHLHLGHKRIPIDGLSPSDSARGRYDMLVLVEGAPKLLAELKAPDVALTSDDIEQARSYAALAQVPLFFLSNGKNSTLRFTSNTAEASGVGGKLSEILEQAAKLAASDAESAVHTLLGSSTATWKTILGEWTAEALRDLTGNARQLRRPLVKDFSFRRDATGLIEGALASGKSVIVVHGPPLSGVTNVLSQVAGSQSLGPVLYVEAHTSKDILQWIANRLMRETNVRISKDSLRQWFSMTRGLVKIVLVIDGMPEKDALDELIDWARGGHFQLVIGVGTEAYHKARSLPGKNQDSPLGLTATAVEIKPLSDDEFGRASDLYFSVFNAGFSQGADYASELRLVSTHRFIAASLPPKKASPEGAAIVIPAILGPDSLSFYSSAFVTDAKHRMRLQKLANLYLKEVEKRIGESDWISGTWGFPSVSPALAEKAFDTEELRSLEEQGFLSWTSTATEEVRLLIRVERIFAHYIAQKWCEDLCAMEKRHSVERRLEQLVSYASVIPDGLISLAAAIARTAGRRDDILSIAMGYLVQRPPVRSRLKTGAKMKLLTKGQDITLQFGEGMEEETIDNPFHWIILSYLAFYPMMAQGDSQTQNVRIFATLGVYEHMLLQPAPASLGDHRPILVHDFPGEGSYLAFEAGIIEPLAQAMIHHAMRFPDEFQALSEHALRSGNAYLIRRIHLVSSHLCDAVDGSVSIIAKNVASKSYEWWVEYLGKELKLPAEFMADFRKRKIEENDRPQSDSSG